MCGRRLRKLCFLLVLGLLVFSQLCYSDVVLTDEEAQELLIEIQKSKTYSNSVMENSLTLEQQLQQYEKMHEKLEAMQREQNQFYRTQSIEAQKSKTGAYIALTVLLVLFFLVLI